MKKKKCNVDCLYVVHFGKYRKIVKLLFLWLNDLQNKKQNAGPSLPSNNIFT